MSNHTELACRFPIALHTSTMRSLHRLTSNLDLFIVNSCAKGASSPRKGPCPPPVRQIDESSFQPDACGLQASSERSFVCLAETYPRAQTSNNTRNRRRISPGVAAFLTLSIVSGATIPASTNYRNRIFRAHASPSPMRNWSSHVNTALRAAEVCEAHRNSQSDPFRRFSHRSGCSFHRSGLRTPALLSRLRHARARRADPFAIPARCSQQHLHHGDSRG